MTEAQLKKRRQLMIRMDSIIYAMAERRRGERGARSLNAYVIGLIQEDGRHLTRSRKPIETRK